MKIRLLFILMPVILMISCNNKNEEIHEYVLVISSDNTKGDFSKLGENREYTVILTANPTLNEKEAEALLKSSIINIKVDKEDFHLSDYIVTNNSINFNISCEENQTKSEINDIIRITILNTRFSLQVSEDIKQSASDIHYEYKIESEITGTYTIPIEGGLYNIPINSKRLTYINDKLISEEPYSLKGLRYVSNCTNIAWGHFDRIYKQKTIGNYIIELIAEGPYNIEGDYFWKVELQNEETSIYSLNIYHTQTSGEEYFIGTKTNYETFLIED